MVAAPVVLGDDDADVSRETRQPVGVTRCQKQVRDPLVEGMVRVNGKVRRAVELHVWACVTKGSPPGERLPSFDLEGGDGHRRDPLYNERFATGPERGVSAG